MLKDRVPPVDADTSLSLSGVSRQASNNTKFTPSPNFIWFVTMSTGIVSKSTTRPTTARYAPSR